MKSTVPIREGLSYDDVLLVPKRTRAQSRNDVDVATRLTRNISLKIPLVSANTPWCTESELAIAMAREGGIGFLHRMCSPERQAAMVAEVKQRPMPLDQHPAASLDSRGRPLVGAAVGTKDDFLRRAELVLRSGADVLVVDVAHGHADYMLEALQRLRRLGGNADIVAGNVATAAGARDLVEAGADAVKVGIGPGGICTTRLVAGAGVPQITAILDCVEVTREAGVPVIADGGIREAGDIAKALAAGASCVMLGSKLAGTDESAARRLEVNGVLYKVTTGFVTLGVGLTLKAAEGGNVTREEWERYVPEGVEATFPYTGALRTLLVQLVGGLRSGMSYSGALSVAELWEKAEFIRVTSNGVHENRPHALTRSVQVHPDYSKELVE